MKRLPTKQSGCAVVVTGKYESFKVETVHWLAQRGIEVTFCDSIYAAAGQLSHIRAEEPVLVVGSAAELGREGGKFFEICLRQPKVWCVCFINGQDTSGKMVALAVHSGALVVNGMADFQNVVDELLNAVQPCGSASDGGKAERSSLMRKQFTVSREELDALLEND